MTMANYRRPYISNVSSHWHRPFTWSETLEIKSHHDANFVITGSTAGCHNDVSDDKVGIMTILCSHWITNWKASPVSLWWCLITWQTMGLGISKHSKLYWLRRELCREYSTVRSRGINSLDAEFVLGNIKNVLFLHSSLFLLSFVRSEASQIVEIHFQGR